MQHSLDASGHFDFADEITSIKGSEALPNCGSEPCVFLKEPVYGLFNHLHRLSAGIAGKLLDSGFLFGTEMYFHDRMEVPRLSLVYGKLAKRARPGPRRPTSSSAS